MSAIPLQAAKPRAGRRFVQLPVWIGFIAVLLAAPLVWPGNFALSMLSQIGIAIIACLSYNILLGQGGMLSFGHAVYSGMGSFFAIHTLNKIADGSAIVPVSALPLVGGVAGLFFAALFGYVSTKKAGTTFAMITLGVGELVWAAALMIPEFFGGESGISGDRVVGEPVLGVSFGPQLEVYYLVAVYCFACTALMYAFTLTPLGRMLNAVRDNPERVEFVGFSTRRIRYLAFMVAGLFAGISGGLAAISFEMVTTEVVSTMRSGAYLLFVFLGGSTVFFGPIIGGILMMLSLVLLSELTKAWLLYLGVFFLLMVIYAPGGIASLLVMNFRVARFGKLARLLPWYAGLLVAAAIPLTGVGVMIEMVYHLQLNSALGTTMSIWGVGFDAAAVSSWVVAVLMFVAGAVAFELLRRRFMQTWSAIQGEIHDEIQSGRLA